MCNDNRLYLVLAVKTRDCRRRPCSVRSIPARDCCRLFASFRRRYKDKRKVVADGLNGERKRVPLSGLGKRGGARTIVATNWGDRWFFVLGFAKNERANIDAAELKALQELAKHYLGFDDLQIEQAIDSGVLTEVRHDDEKA